MSKAKRKALQRALYNTQEQRQAMILHEIDRRKKFQETIRDIILTYEALNTEGKLAVNRRITGVNLKLLETQLKRQL